ncbi:MAG TPA: hypothetical protein VGF92_05415 [Stellaceae bacterium]|jgi:hypothetical protein
MAISNQFKLVNRIGTFAQTVGRQPLNLDVGAPLTGIDIRLRYTVATGATAPTGVQYGAVFQLAQLIQRMELVVNGEDTVMSVQPWLYIARFAQERGGLFPRGFETPINMAANQNTNVDVHIPIHFDLIRGRKRNDCAVDLRGIRAAQLYLTFGGAANLFGVPGATVAISNIIVDIEATYIEQVPARDKNGKPILFAVRQLDELTLPLPGANNQTTLDIDQRTGVNLISLGMFFDTLIGGVHGGDDTGLINGATFQGDLKLRSGGSYFGVTQAAFVKARARDEMRLINAGQALDVASMLNPEFPGFFFWDQRYDGKLSTGIPTGALDANLQLLLNQNFNTGNTTLFVQRESVRPLNVGI